MERAQPGTTPRPVRIRERTPADISAVCDVLARQQPLSRYPLRWPLPFPVEDFVVRRGELGAFVAVTGETDETVDGRVVGHVSVTPLVGSAAAGDVAAAFEAATGLRAEEMGVVSVLVVDPEISGGGVGRRLVATAVERIRGLGLHPVLDVVPTHGGALRLYRHLGWEQVGTTRPQWLPDTEPDVVLMRLPPDVGQGAARLSDAMRSH